MKIALITGITGQDGSFLAELLVEKGYEAVSYTHLDVYKRQMVYILHGFSILFIADGGQ